MGKKVGIIGAGISGLLACKYVLQKGFEPIVFESQPGLGGVWTHTLETTKLQTAKQAYEFSDFPWPSSVKEEFPNHNQVMKYLGSYAVHFGLFPYIKFNTNVININYVVQDGEEMHSWSHWGGTPQGFSTSDLKGKWEIATGSTTAAHEHNVYEVEFVILCIGRHSGFPNIPDFPPNKGPDAFINGKVIHSMDYSAMDDSDAAKFVKGKRVTVVGFQKSALDIANECATANGVEYPCTLLFRRLHWNLPIEYTSYFDSLYLSRFSELMLHKPGEGPFYSLLATLFSPLRWAITIYLESLIKSKFPLKKYELIPDQSFSHDVMSCAVSTVAEKFYDRLEEGSIICKKAKGFSFYADGLVIHTDATTGVPVETDVVILATGYKGELKLKSIFRSPTFQTSIMGSSNSTVPLYRECINPRIPQLAVIGYSESFSDLFTSEMRCKWLAHYLDGGFELPSIKEMEKDVFQWEIFMKRYSGMDYRNACIGPLHIWYNDQLCKDMGCNPRRKKGFFAEMFEPYGPMDYANLTPTRKNN
ncbi:hypothetical protein MKW92_028135 [Papaver armeniacum]|nr:hypothetical protein MKW92_028135 [Papaver armeniacum]